MTRASVIAAMLCAGGCVPPPGNSAPVDTGLIVDATLLLSAGQAATTPIAGFPGLWVRIELSSVDVLRPYGGLSHADGRGSVEVIPPDAASAGRSAGCARLSDRGDDLLWVQDALGGDGLVSARVQPLAEGEVDLCSP